MGREVEIRVELIGFTPQTKTVTLGEGTTTVAFSLNSTALRLQELVVTGVAGSSAGVDMPRTVERATAPSQAASGQIMLRGPTTISGRAVAGGESYTQITENDFHCDGRTLGPSAPTGERDRGRS